MKLLVLATESIPEEDVREIVEANEDEGADVFVLSPTVVDSKLAYWVSDVDAAREQAQTVAEDLVDEFESAGAAADGRTGDVDPKVAIDDALREFGPDRILIVKHPEGEEAYREDDLLEHVRESAGVPVEFRDVPRADSP